ncbi:helix-turn-helix domain-containing protein [Leuconostoc pseudomesenteroides]|uniref:helix-turn-helix domain-containing protein n=1 Tax=Leuconostoc pseudomesenteroides TaxID=33968 RepID=UPI0032DF7621
MSVTAERIQTLRQQKKLTQSELADLVGTTRVTIGRIERDINKPSIGMLSLIADALDTTMDYLQGKTNDSRPYKSMNDIVHSSFRPLYEQQSKIKRISNLFSTKSNNSVIDLDIKDIFDDENFNLLYNGNELTTDDVKKLNAFLHAYF